MRALSCCQRRVQVLRELTLQVECVLDCRGLDVRVETIDLGLHQAALGEGTQELDEAYRLGLEQGRKEGKYDPLLEDLPAFEPWTSGARFEPMRSWFDSLLSYERAVTENLRDARFTVVRRLRSSRLSCIALARVLGPDVRLELNDCKREIALVDRVQRFISNQLYLVRRAVDAELGVQSRVRLHRGGDTQLAVSTTWRV